MFDGTCEEFAECVCLVRYASACVSLTVCVFLWGSSAGRVFFKGAKQLPFTAPGANKQAEKGSYLPLLLARTGLY